MTKIITDGNEEVYQIKRKKQLDFGDSKKGDKGKKKNEPEAPAEMIKAGDDLVIKNYDVDYEEENPDIRMLGGIRGIRALRVQRDYMPDIDAQTGTAQDGNMFSKYEKKQGAGSGKGAGQRNNREESKVN